jgi:Uma2 family endonuclease
MTSAPRDVPDRHWTVEDYMQLDDDQRCEIIEGERYVTPAPTTAHQYFTTLFGAELAIYVRDHDLGQVYTAPFDVFLADDTVVQPDLTFVAADRVDEALDEQGAIEAPDLVVEVASPSTARRDRVEKRRLYGRHGVSWLLLVEPESRVVEVFHLDEASGRYVLEASFGDDETFEIGYFPDFELELDDVWPTDAETST